MDRLIVEIAGTTKVSFGDARVNSCGSDHRGSAPQSDSFGDYMLEQLQGR